MKILRWIKYEWEWITKKNWEIIDEWHNPVYRPNLHNMLFPNAVYTWKNKLDGKIREQIIVL